MSPTSGLQIESATLAQSLRQARSAAGELSSQLRGVRQALTRGTSGCADGSCSLRDAPERAATGGAGGSSNSGGGTGGSGYNPFGAFANGVLRGAFSSAASGNFNAGDALRQGLSSMLRSTISSLTRGIGGGAGGGLLGGLLGSGLSLLAGGLLSKLFHKRQALEPRALDELLNFPQVTSLDYASNPASRLFGGRATARGPAFSVEVNYRGGAEELVSAKVASKLLDSNSFRGIV